jgi:hypothetical protein
VKDGDVIELADVVSNLRSELYRAVGEGSGQSLQFEVGSIELELSVSVEQTDGAHGGVKFWVVELGGDLGEKNVSAQKLTLSLTPTIETPQGRTSPRISGAPEAGEE